MWGIFFVMAFSVVAAEPVRVEVMAGEWERRDSIVEIHLPGLSGRVIGLQGAGVVFPMQVDHSGVGRFVVPYLSKGKSVTYEVVAAPKVAKAVVASKVRKKIRFQQGERTILEYQAEPGTPPRADIKEIYQRGGYLHPLFTPGGRQVTEDYPLKHTHHHGIWFPWTKTEFEGRHPDFWNSAAGTAKIRFAGLERSWSGPVHAGLMARHEFVDLTSDKPKVVLKETWTVRVFALQGKTRPRWVFDLESVQRCAGPEPLLMPQYRYGGLGVRGHASWDHAPDNDARFFTANGVTDRKAGHATRARWCHMGGKVDGQLAGVAILCHPKNFRFPQPMRIHPSEPFFNFAPQQWGAMAIRPGRPYVSRYRFVVADGPPDKAELDRLWQDYAQPPRAAAVRK